MSIYHSSKKCNATRFGIIFITVVLTLLLFAPSVFCYELNGTATGNILQGGYNAEGKDFTASSDIENGYALMITQKGKTVTADGNNSASLNICGNTVYYITVNGAISQTELRSYNVLTGKCAVLYSVPMGEGMKYLFVTDNNAYFQSNGNVLCFDLTAKTVKTVLAGVSAFIPVNDSFLYTKGADLYYRNAKITEDCLYFDCDDDTVYFSNGEDGVYAMPLSGGKAQRLGNGGTSLVSDGTAVYWQCNDLVLSYEKNQVRFEQAVTEDTTSVEILPETGLSAVEDSVGEGGSISSNGNLALNAATNLGMPAGDYKNWKQFDSRWGDIHLGSSSYTIRSSGCAATSVAILLVGSGATSDRYLKGDFDPGIFVKEMSNNGGFTGSGGIYWSKVGSLYPTFNNINDNKSFSSEGLAGQCSAINTHMASHNYLVLQVKTSGTHFVAADYAKDNVIYVCDPGKSNSNTLEPYKAGNIAYRAVVFKYSGNNSNWGGGNSDNPVQPTPKETVATPKISIDGNTITISCATSGASIYYTKDGSTPTANSTRYSKPFTLSSNAVIKAIAVKDGYNNSGIAQASFKKSPFYDVKSNDWFFDPVLRAYNAKLIAGMDSTHFSPNSVATRAQFVAIISRINDQEMMEYYSEFEDLSEDWYIDPVNWAFCNGITAGFSDYIFGPYEKVTREQACCFLVRMANYLNEKVEEGTIEKGTIGKAGSLLDPVTDKITFKDDKKISSWAKEDVETAQRAGLIFGVNEPNGIYFYPQKIATRAEIAAMVIRMVEGNQ